MEYRLKDCLEKVIDNRGKNPKYFDKEKYPVIDNVFIKNNYYINDKIVNRYINQETYNNFLRGYVEENMPIMTLVGSGIGNVGLIKNENVAIVQNTIGFKTKENLDSKYLYYWFLTKQNELQSFNRGSGQPSIKKTDVENMEIDLPDIEIQKKIVNILEKLDDKIYLNNQINDNLYEILNKLYKQKYLNCELYDEWEQLTLDDVTSKFATGLNPRKNFVLGHGNNFYVTIKNMPNNQVVLDDKCDKVDDEAIKKINKRSDLRVGDLLFSGIGTIGRTYLIKEQPTNWNISESVFTIRANERVSPEFLYLLLLSTDMQNYAISKASGSVQKGIRMADLKLYKLRVPDQKWMTDFTNVISPMINKIYENIAENNDLTQLRDTLLPKLMNGEIDLDKIEI